MKKIYMGETEIDECLNAIKQELLSKKGLPEQINYKLNPSIKLEDAEKVAIFFSEKAQRKMDALIAGVSDEVGWYGTVNRTGEREFHIDDILMFPQMVTGITVDTDDQGYSNWIGNLESETKKAMRFYGHSHVNMGCTPSGVDTAHYGNMIQNCRDFYIFGIFNKRKEYWFEVYDIASNILYEKNDILYVPYIPPISEEEVWATEQIKENVKKKTTPTVTSNLSDFYSKKSKKKDVETNWRSMWDYEY